VKYDISTALLFHWWAGPWTSNLPTSAISHQTIILNIVLKFAVPSGMCVCCILW